MLGPLFSFERLRGFDQCDGAEWDHLLDVSNTRSIFQTLSWQAAWWKVFGQGELLLYRITCEKHVLAIAPLYADSGMVFFVGSGGSDYLDFVGNLNDPNTLRTLLTKARDATPGFVGFRFYHVLDDSPTGRLLNEVAEDCDLNCFDEGEIVAPLLRFGDWPIDHRPPTEKKSLLRHHRKLESLGSLRIDHLTDESEILAYLPEFFEQHIAQWGRTPTPSLFLNEKQRQFYRELVRTRETSNWLRFARVAIDNRAVAYHLGSSYRGNFLWYKPSYDISWARYSPGEVLIRALLQRSQDERSEIFDFGLGDEAFKFRFATHTRCVRTWGLYPHR